MILIFSTRDLFQDIHIFASHENVKLKSEKPVKSLIKKLIQERLVFRGNWILPPRLELPENSTKNCNSRMNHDASRKKCQSIRTTNPLNKTFVFIRK